MLNTLKYPIGTFIYHKEFPGNVGLVVDQKITQLSGGDEVPTYIIESGVTSGPITKEKYTPLIALAERQYVERDYEVVELEKLNIPAHTMGVFNNPNTSIKERFWIIKEFLKR